MGIKEEPTFIEGENGRYKNPIFGSVSLVKNKDMKTVHDFNHEHYWEIEQEYPEFTNIKCKCGKGKMLAKGMTVKDGKIIAWSVEGKVASFRLSRLIINDPLTEGG